MNINTIKSKLSSWQAQRRQRQEEKKRKRIEAIAHRIYENRQVKQDKGANADWQTAERIVGNPLKWFLFQLNKPLVAIDKHSSLIEAAGVIAIPIVLAIATHAYQVQSERTEENRLQQQALKDYLNQLSTILLEVKGDDLRNPENEQIRTLMTATTLTLLRDPNFDGTRKGQVISYLAQMNLIQGILDNPETSPNETEEPIVLLVSADLRGADLEALRLGSVFFNQADLRDASIIGADLSDAALYRSNFDGADLSGANLSDAALYRSNFDGADLSGANLSDAALYRSNFDGADLSGANLSNAYLRDANFYNADLQGASLRGTNLYDANFYRTNLSDADFTNANLTAVDGLNDALFCKTQLPTAPLSKYENIDPNRDCEELGVVINPGNPE